LTLRRRPGRGLVIRASMPPRLNNSIHNRTIRSVRQNCWQSVPRGIPISNERIALRRTYDRLLGAASMATRSSSSVAFSALGCSSGVLKASVQPHLTIKYQLKTSPYPEIYFENRSNWRHAVGKIQEMVRPQIWPKLRLCGASKMA